MQGIAGALGFFFEHLVLIFSMLVMLQLVFCYALQVMADKQAIPATSLAWVPLLQLYPLIRVGGIPFSDFLVLIAGSVVAGIVGAIAGPLGVVVIVAWCVWMLVFLVRLMWKTAENRGIPGWVGLLSFIPFVNLFVYPYLAFHDGMLPPRRLGLLLGFVFIVLPAIPQLRTAHELAQFGPNLGPMAAAAEQGNERAMRGMMRDMLEMMQGMSSFEMESGDAEAMSKALEELGADFEAGGEIAAVTSTSGGRAQSAMPEVDELETISENFECLQGARARGTSPPRGFERWCELVDSAGRVVRHGGYASWHRNGQLREAGIYQYGEREGVWTRWYISGGKETQAEFERGRQHGLLLTWDEIGRKRRQVRYEGGEPVGG